MPIETHLKLARFAGGCSSPTERSEVKKLLLEDPELIPLLVAKLHELRAEIARP